VEELLLAQGEEEVALVLARVAALAEDRAATIVSVFALDDGVVAGGDEAGAEAAGFAPEVAELELLVAHDARVGGAPALVLAGKVLDDLGLEVAGLLDHVMGMPRVWATARASAMAEGPQHLSSAREMQSWADFHRHADDVVALLLEEMGGYGGIDAAGHADDDAGMGVRCSIMLCERGRYARGAESRARRAGRSGYWVFRRRRVMEWAGNS